MITSILIWYILSKSLYDTAYTFICVLMKFNLSWIYFNFFLKTYKIDNLLKSWRNFEMTSLIFNHIARDIFTIYVNDVLMKTIFNNVYNVCHYYRSRILLKTIKWVIMNFCADKFELNDSTQLVENIVSFNSKFVNDRLIDEIIDLIINNKNEIVSIHWSNDIFQELSENESQNVLISVNENEEKESFTNLMSLSDFFHCKFFDENHNEEQFFENTDVNSNESSQKRKETTRCWS